MKQTTIIERNSVIGYYPDGRQARKRIRARNEAEYARLRAQACLEFEQSLRDYDTLADCAFKWYREKKEPYININTSVMYENLLKHITEDTVGKMELSKITNSDLQQFINRHIDTPNICKKLKMCLNSVYEFAIENGYVDRNPTKSLSIPKGEPIQRNVFTNEQICALVNAQNIEPSDKAFALVQCYFGLRPGEALALRKSDFDFSSNKPMLTVQRSVAYLKDGNTPYIKDTKTHNIRKIPIHNEARRDLYDYVEHQDDLLFTMANGGLVTKSSCRKKWLRIKEQWNTLLDEPIDMNTRLYTFRYTYATTLYYSDISLLMASRYMGHANTKMLLEVYAQLDEAREDTTSLNGLFGFMF